MSLRILATALLVASTFTALAAVAHGENDFLDAARSGYASASDISLSATQPPDSPPSPGKPDQTAGSACLQCNAGCECTGGATCGCGSSCSCGSSCGCGSGQCDDNCGRFWQWTAGAEGTYLSPNFHRDGVLGPESVGSVTLGWQAAPRIWLGVENCNGWGAQRATGSSADIAIDSD